MPYLKYMLLFICLHLFAKQILFAQKNQNISSELTDSIPQLIKLDSLLQIKSPLDSLSHFSISSQMDSVKINSKQKFHHSSDSSLLIFHGRADSIEKSLTKIQSKENQYSVNFNRKYFRKVKHSTDSLLKIYKTPTDFQKYYKNPGLQNLSPIQNQASEILKLYANKNVFPSKFRLSSIRKSFPDINSKIRSLSIIPGNSKNLLSEVQKGKNTFTRDTSILKDPDQLQSLIDKAAETKVSQLDEVKFLQSQNKSNLLTGSPTIPSNNLNPASAINPLTSARQFGKKYFQNYQEVVQNAQNSLDRVKQKYKYVPDVTDLKNAEKNNQVDENIFKRLKYGCDFHLIPGNPSYGDVYPYIGYQFNKNFSMGISGIARISVNSPDTIRIHSGISSYGYRGQAEYIFLKGIFMHGEYENMITMNEKFKNNEFNKTVGRNFNLGIGRSFTLCKGLKGNIKLLYNFKLDDNKVYKNPWLIRFGFSN